MEFVLTWEVEGKEDPVVQVREGLSHQSALSTEYRGTHKGESFRQS